MDESDAKHDRYEAIVESAPYVLLVIAEDGTIAFVNEASRVLLGREPHDLIGTNGFDMLAPESAEVAILLLAEVQSRQSEQGSSTQVTEVPLDVVWPDGSRKTLLMSGHEAFTPAADGTVVRARPVDGASLLDGYLLASHRQAPLEEIVEPLLRGLAADIPLGAVSYGFDWNADTLTFGSVVDELIDVAAVPVLDAGGPWVEALAGKAVICPTRDEMPAHTAADMSEVGLEACWSFPVGSVETRPADSVLVLWRRTAGGPWGTEDRRVQQVVGFIELARERRQKESQLAYAVTHDALTGVANRSYFFEELRRVAPGPVAVLYLDLDGFKPVNDQLGHVVGDRVLTEVARSLQAAVGDHATVARVGGDEFAVVCHAPDHDVVRELASTLVSAATTTVEGDGVTLEVRASVGVAFGEGPSGERLLSAADEAMYVAKRRGGGQVQLAE